MEIKAMRFLVMTKATKESEAGAVPDLEIMKAMTAFNEELGKAGVLLAAEGLHPSSKGMRVAFSNGTKTVTDGPFAETKELVGGYWIWQVNSREEALEWAKKCPAPGLGESQIELRQIIEMEDFWESIQKNMTPEMKEYFDHLAALHAPEE
jgi:hypothetical protein